MASGADVLSKTGEAIPRPRIQTLSDLIFGLALSIGALSLLNAAPKNLFDLAESLLGFGWAFVILALVWVRYTRITSVLPIETGMMVGANLFLLFLVSIEPYLYNLINSSLDRGITTSLYAADMGALFLVMTFFLGELTKEERKLIPRSLLTSYRLQAYGNLAAAALFLISILPVFWIWDIQGVPMRFVLWMGTFFVMVVRRGVERRAKVENPQMAVKLSDLP
ncbi:MAG TPA: TMEM175 family protein [Nitrososphaerales archaeon]|nr:TMEM175 family protein [Nitrososphaerales archaeon]